MREKYMLYNEKILEVFIMYTYSRNVLFDEKGVPTLYCCLKIIEALPPETFSNDNLKKAFMKVKESRKIKKKGRR